MLFQRLAVLLALGEKPAVEIAKSIDAADDVVDRHLLHPAIALTLHGDAVAHIGIGHEDVWLAPERS